MGFLKSKDDNEEKWKEKYFKLLNTQELLEKDHKANEELLCKTIIRFALAVKGLNRELDPHLNRIRKLLKSGLQSQQLQKELESFSNALISLEDPTPRLPDASVLFDFLFKQYPQHSDNLAKLQNDYEQDQFKSSQALFIALLNLTTTEKTKEFPELNLELPLPDLKAVRSHLLSVFDDLEIPEQLQTHAQQIKSKLQIETNLTALGDLLDETVLFLLELKKLQVHEQQALAEYLSKLTLQLADLSLKASGVSTATENAIRKRNLLDETVAQQMEDLQAHSANATQLEPLKQLVDQQLSSISRQILSYKQQEQQERESLLVELSALTQKVTEMESESCELKSKLDIAQHKATRDPLTNLPNRLAFEDRLNDEMARSQRHSTPLTMIVWDIDHFKKINDTYGHKSGDKALIIIAQLLAKHCRQTDFVARFGGEEFVMLLPETDASTALLVADKLRETVERANFKAEGDRLSITLSCGISQITDKDNNETLFERADKALYQAKQNGRNQCVLA